MHVELFGRFSFLPEDSISEPILFRRFFFVLSPETSAVLSPSPEDGLTFFGENTTFSMTTCTSNID